MFHNVFIYLFIYLYVERDFVIGISYTRIQWLYLIINIMVFFYGVSLGRENENNGKLSLSQILYSKDKNFSPAPASHSC